VESFRHSPFDERWFDFERTLKRDGWVDSTLREFERITTPYLRITRPYSTEPLPPEGAWDELRLGGVVSFTVKFPPEHAEKFEIASEALPAVVKILCRGLEHAAGLLADIETRHWRTAAFSPEEKPGETHLGEADRYLIRVVRFFDRLATEQPERARAEIGLWPQDDEFFFDKLKIYVLMKAHLFSGHECAEGILALTDRAFWDNYLRRELLHTLRARWDEFPDEERRLIEERILRGPDQRYEEDAEEYARRKASSAATILGWLALNNCEISEDVQCELPRLREANPDWRPSWDTSADHDWEARGGNVRVDTDASKVIDAPLAEVVSIAEEHTTHPFGEFTEYRPFDGLVKERPLRALSALSLEARNDRYPTRLWRSALTDWPDDTSDRLRCLFAFRLIRLPSQVVFDLRHRIEAPVSSRPPRSEADTRGGPHGASDRLRLDVSFHLPGVPFGTVTPVHFSGGPVSECKPDGCLLIAERAGSRCLGPFRARPLRDRSVQTPSSNRGRKSPLEAHGKRRFPRALASGKPHIRGISSEPDSRPSLFRSDR